MVEQSKGKRRAPSAARERRGHPWQRYRAPVPMPLRAPSNAIDCALQTLWPTDLHKLAVAYLGTDAQTIRDWRRAKSKAPQWALDKIAAELRKTAAARIAAAEAIEKERGRG